MDINDAVRWAQEEIESYKNAQKNILELKEQIKSEIIKLQETLRDLDSAVGVSVSVAQTDSNKESESPVVSHVPSNNDKNSGEDPKPVEPDEDIVEEKVEEEKKTPARSTRKQVSKKEAASEKEETKESSEEKPLVKESPKKVDAVDEASDGEDDSIFDLNSNVTVEDGEDFDDIPF